MLQSIKQQRVSYTNLFKELGFTPIESISGSKFYLSKSTTSTHTHTYPFTYPLINDVDICIDSSNDINTGIVSITEDYSTTIPPESSAHFPLFLHHTNKIRIPKKVLFALQRHTPRGLLRDIHPDIDVAIELCLLYTSLLSSTYYGYVTGDNPEGWKSLKAKYLREFIPEYRKIRVALKYPLKKGAIIVCDHLSIQGSKSFSHRLGDAYFGKGVETYELKTPIAIGLLNKRFRASYQNAITNPICQNLIELYPSLTLPMEAEIMDEARRLVDQKYVTSKGKRLVFRNKHPKSYFKNPEQLSFVEDALSLYRYLTEDGLMVPTEGSKQSGGRVIDSFTLMPKWIRNLVKINGVRFTDIDYSCLHPNLAVKLYGGQTEFITHKKVADAIQMDVSRVKVEHLSFFNKKFWQMKESPLYEHYNHTEPQMMQRIIAEKLTRGYKISSQKMFELEVKIMTDVIQTLNSEGIHVGYIYDALFCHPSHALRVKEVMDSIILKHGVKTTAKLSEQIQMDLSDLTPKVEAVPQSSPANLRVVSYKQINNNSTAKDQLLSMPQDEIQFEDVLVDFQDGDDPIQTAVTYFYDELRPDQCYVRKRFLFDE